MTHHYYYPLLAVHIKHRTEEFVAVGSNFPSFTTTATGVELTGQKRFINYTEGLVVTRYWLMVEVNYTESNNGTVSFVSVCVLPNLYVVRYVNYTNLYFRGKLLNNFFKFLCEFCPRFFNKYAVKTSFTAFDTFSC